MELIGTLFGLMGFGWIYAGYTRRGITLLLIWLCVYVVAVGSSVLTLGVAACIAVPLVIFASIVSALRAREAVERYNLGS